MTSPLMKINNLSFSIGEKHIINHITLSINPGDFVVILGGNGSGKSTLLKLINQTYRCTSGKIIFPENFKIVTLTQFITDSIFTDLTIEENALLIESASPQPSFHKKTLLAELPTYLSQFNPNLPKALKTRVNQLSGGEQQILAFALYLRHQPDLLLLDEHTSALDPKKADGVMALTHEYLLKNRITCLMTTHSLPYAVKYGNRLIALRDGQIVFEADTEQKLILNSSDLLQHCY